MINTDNFKNVLEILGFIPDKDGSIFTYTGKTSACHHVSKLVDFTHAQGGLEFND